MPRPERGTTPAGFRERLLALLRNAARSEGVSAQRLQNRVAFERLLARLSTQHWLVKGGFALELRYSWLQRPTKDIDLRTELSVEEAVAQLRRELLTQPRDDMLTFELGTVGDEMQGAPDGAVRVPITARLAGSVFASFHLDISSGDAVVGSPDLMVGSGLLLFAGIQPITFPIYPVTQHLAEKLHAYTLPRDTTNTRAKDLFDMIAMVTRESVESEMIRASLQATFKARGTHELPATLMPPPQAWRTPFATLRSEAPGMALPDLEEGFRIAGAFWNPVLSGTLEVSTWNPTTQEWKETAQE